MRIDLTKFIHGTAFMLALSLAACGGGGGGTTAADTTAPITTAAPAVSGTTETSTTLSVTIDENGTGYYLVQPAADPTPTVAAVQARTSFAMTANKAATQAISGLTSGTDYKIYFVAKDAANNVQTTVQSVAVTTAAYVVEGRLNWMPATFTDTWTDADTYCNTTTINGQTGWRLPKQSELRELYASGAMNGKGWALNYTWSSTAGSGQSHSAVSLNSGDESDYVTSSFYVTCVRPVPAMVQQGGLAWMPVTFADTWTKANDYCASYSINGLSGWRMPSPDELVALYKSGAMNNQGWTLDFTWSSKDDSTDGGHYQFRFDTGVVGWWQYDTGSNYVSCVRTTTIVSQGGLSWMPVSFADTWTNANAYCNTTTINGLTGWRLPNRAELEALYKSSAMNGQGWILNGTWSSTPIASGYVFIDLSNGNPYWAYDGTYYAYVTCVHN